MSKAEHLKPGVRWYDSHTKRVVVILDPEYEDCMCSWYYEDNGPTDWHYCCVESFVVWNEYTPLIN